MEVEKNKEQLILEAAEAEFLEKGYQVAKTTAIAKRAGVTHAMLHYYFRTKEKLFQMVFKKKIQLLAGSFQEKLNENLPFEEIVRSFIEVHFDFIQQNPKLISFVYNEIMGNKENRQLLLNEIYPRFYRNFDIISKMIEAEVKKGTIRPIKPLHLLMNIASMNVITFMAYPIVEELLSEKNPDFLENLLKERKESNVQFILNALMK